MLPLFSLRHARKAPRLLDAILMGRCWELATMLHAGKATPRQCSPLIDDAVEVARSIGELEAMGDG